MPRPWLRFVPLLLALFAPVSLAEDAAGPVSFEGRWRTSFGELTLDQDGREVEGAYPNAGTLSGVLRGRRLTFQYEDRSGSGEGWFELARDGASFTGQWRPRGQEAWQEWTGTRLPPGPAFHGLFRTEYGPVRLVRRGDSVRGAYRYQGSAGALGGRAGDGKLTFTWREGETTGEGYFEVAADDPDAISGGWRAPGEADWRPWSGRRVVPPLGQRWLVVLEAHWEEELDDPEYAFGAMLRTYLHRYPRVEVRHRRVHDQVDLERALAEVPFLPGPSVLVLSGHGEKGKLLAGDDAVDPTPIGRVLSLAPDVALVHFSACEIMVGDVAARLRKVAGPGAPPVSGYATAVDWSASALLELLYLELVLGRGYAPGEAARLVRRELRFSGDEAQEGSPLGAARFRLVE